MRRTVSGAVTFVLLMQFCFFLVAEESFFESKMGEDVEMEGQAVNTMMGAIVQTQYGTIYIEDLEYWPDDILGSLIKVRGKITKKYDLPVFIQKEGEPQKSGIPVPPGTDLKEAGKRYLLQDADWGGPISNVNS